MEEDFPRGAVIRRATRSTDEKKKCFVQLGVKRSLEDVLFKDSEQATPSKGKKKKKTKKSEGEETEEPDLEEEFEGATETEGFIPKTLTSKTLSEGMLVLAVVQEIHEYEIVLSLPNGQTAFVQITDVSSFFTQQLQELNESNGAEDQDLPNIQDVYQVGNLVPCKVKSLGASKDGHRRIQASLDYKEVNSELGISFIKAGMTLHGCVSSVEDHGYTIDLGIRGTNAFLAKEEATKGAKGRKGETMKTGKLVTCLVKAVKANGRSIILTFDPERLKSCKATKATHTTFSSLIPGTRLDAMVTKVLSNSLIMDIFGLYKGCVDPIHLKDTVDELTKYDIGQKLVAVVLYNCPTTKSIGLSLNPAHHKTTFDPATDVIRDLSPGDIIEAALVVRVQEKENLIVQLNPKTRGIVYHSHGSDDKQKRYSPASVGEKVRCRILSFNLFDRLAIVSMRKSILDKPFLGINDVKPGMLVKGVIESVMSRGVAVKIQDRIHGFVPRTHLADIPVQKPQERFTIGSEIELRVLLVEPAKRRVLLTHKKTMVKSSLPFLASYAQPKLGMWIHGCVVAVKDFGCIVSFYNDVKGIIPRAELGMDESSSPTDNFYVGQVLKCRVLRTHSPESKKLALSLRKDGRKERESFEAGKIVKVKISKVKQDGLEVIQLPGNKPAFIPKTHLSDHPDICDALLASYSEGDVIDQALTWSYSGKSRTCIVTCKPLLLNAARNKTEIVRDFSELETNMFLIGVLRHTMSYGVFVEFPNHIVGLAPKAMMSDEFVSDTSKLYEVGQTLRAKVTEVNVEKKRFLVSLKTSDCFQDDAACRSALLLKEKKEFKHVISHKVGSLVHATVRNTPGKGIICSLPHAVDAVIPQDHVHGKSPKVGDSIEACVMNIDLSSKAVTLSLKPDTIEGCKKSKSKGKKGKKAVASLAEDKGKVLMVKSEFILAQTGQGKLVYLSAKQHLNNFSVQKDAIKIGDTVTIGDSSFVDGRFLAALVKEDKPSKKKEKERKSAAVHDTSQKLVGQIVDAVVKSVKESQVNIEIEGGQGYGRIHATEVSDTMKPGSYPLEFFTIGQKVKAKVIGCRRGKRGQHLAVSHGHGALSLLELSTRKSVMEADSVPSEDQSSENEMNAFQIGQTVTCIINRFHKEILWVHLSRSLEGKIHRLNLSKHASTLENPESYFKPGQVHRAKVVRQDNEHNMLELSMSGCIATTFEVGSVVNCKVTKILENKAQVQLPYGLQGSMFATDIDDIYQENPLERFEHHKYHRCCISEASTGKHGASVSMRPSQVKKATPPSGYDLEIRTLDDLKKGQVVRGYVRHCSEKGVFVSLSSNLHGRILLKKLSAFYVKDPSAVFTVGKLLSTKVLSIDKKSGKIELSSSSKDTGLEDPVPEDQRQAGVKRKRDGTKKGKKSTEDGNDSGLGEADPLSDTEAEIITVAKKSSSDTPRLQISSGFSWGDTTTKPATSRKAGTADESDDDDDEEDEEEEEDNEPPVKTSKKDLKEEEKAQEDILYKTERALMDAERTPETPEDFDRLVASSPNSSLAWIRYMAFYLHSVDIEKARAIAERALKTINFREEQEKLNVWVAYLNLENLYGTEEEVVAVFKRALQQCEPIKVFQQLVSIYTRTSKIEQAEQLYETMVKRFKFDPDVWIGFGTFLMKHGKHDPARRLMQRSFKSLIQKDHVSVIVKFAQLEYRHAESERGKTMFENILSNYPKRTDIWSIYLDLTIKQGDTGTSRHLFERVINLKLSAKKVKFFFKRFLDFEKKYGDESTINSVKQKAVDYVESKTVVAEDS
eukprot:XP_011664181.1 PREDICTED: protein RRP5 homolog [Strongylocentrotus purpuratus]